MRWIIVHCLQMVAGQSADILKSTWVWWCRRYWVVWGRLVIPIYRRVRPKPKTEVGRGDSRIFV